MMHQEGRFDLAQNTPVTSYEDAYNELHDTDETHMDVSPKAKELIDDGEGNISSRSAFPDKGSDEGREKWIKKYGYEKALEVLTAREGMTQKRMDKEKAKGTAQGDMDASISEGYVNHLQKLKADYLGRQGY